MEFKRLQFKTDHVADDGTFTGLASAANVKDLGGDIVVSGAFQRTIKDFKDSGRAMPLLWNHDFKDVRGAWLDLEENDEGLKAKGQLNMDTAGGRDAGALLNQGAVDGLSIGYEIAKGGIKFDADKDAVLLTDLDLWEISIATFPMNLEARVDRVKGMLRRGEKPTRRDFERALHELGFSQTEAKSYAKQIEDEPAGMVGDSANNRDGWNDLSNTLAAHRMRAAKHWFS